MPDIIEGIKKYKIQYNMTNTEYQDFLDRIGILLDGYTMCHTQAILIAIKEMEQERKWINMKNIEYH